jgi:hypothetical protein
MFSYRFRSTSRSLLKCIGMVRPPVYGVLRVPNIAANEQIERIALLACIWMLRQRSPSATSGWMVRRRTGPCQWKLRRQENEAIEAPANTAERLEAFGMVGGGSFGESLSPLFEGRSFGKMAEASAGELRRRWFAMGSSYPEVGFGSHDGSFGAQGSTSASQASGSAQVEASGYRLGFGDVHGRRLR